MSIDFVFFYIDTETNELSNKHKSLDRDDIIYFIKSIKKYHPESKIIHCTDLFTKSFSDVDLVHRVKFDTNFLMYGKIKSFSTLKIDKTTVYLDPDMLVMKNIPISSIEDKADVFLLKRSFNNEMDVPLNFRGIKFSNHQNKKYIDVYPYIACLVICKQEIFWKKCLDYFDNINNNYKLWFGDQEIFRLMVEKKTFTFGFIEEKNFACPPQYLKGNTRPFILHFKGKINKQTMKEYYKYV